MTMMLKIGRRLRFPCSTLAEASALYGTARDASGEGSSTWPEGRITGPLGSFNVSYNGRVWSPQKPEGAEPLVSTSGWLVYEALS